MSVKRILIGGFAAIISFSLFFSGCGGKSTDSKDEQSSARSNSTQTTSAETTAQKEPVTLKIAEYANNQKFPDGMDVNNNPIMEALREKTGYNIMIENISEEQKVTLLFASGDAPDILCWANKNLFVQFQEQGVLAALDDYLKDKSNIMEFVPDSLWMTSKINGKIYAIPDPSPFSGLTGLAMRTDWLERVGMQAPKSIDELYAVLKAFTDMDPDGNGKNDTAGITMQNTMDILQYGCGPSLFWSLFDMPNEYFVKDGKIVYSPIQPEAKEMLQFVIKLYSEGVLDKDFPVSKGDSVAEKVGSSRVGAVTPAWWDYKAYKDTLIAKTGKDVLAIVDPPKTVTGKDLKFINTNALQHYIMISKDCKHPDDAVRFIDMLLTEDIGNLVNYGFEGEHWTREGDSVKFTDKFKEIEYKHYYSGMIIQKPEMWEGIFSEYMPYYKPTEKTAAEVDISLQLPPAPELAETLVKLREYVNTELLKMVVNKNIDGFDSFVQEWLKRGGQEVLDRYNELYQQSK